MTAKELRKQTEYYNRKKDLEQIIAKKMYEQRDLEIIIKIKL